LETDNLEHSEAICSTRGIQLLTRIIVLGKKISHNLQGGPKKTAQS